MKYQSQKVAMLYFYGALGPFIAQVLFGVVAGTIYVLPNTLSELLPFNIVRMIHTNAADLILRDRRELSSSGAVTSLALPA